MVSTSNLFTKMADNSFRLTAQVLLIILIIANATPLKSQQKVPMLAQWGGQETLLQADEPHWGNGIDCLSCHVPYRDSDMQVTNAAGNANLCLSCHNPAGLASDKALTDAHRAQPGVSGTSHAWDVPVTNETFGAEPPTASEMAKRTYDGLIVCSTCHNQHEQTFPPFLRGSNFQNALCKDCHSVRNVGSFRESSDRKGSHPVGMPYPAADPRFFDAPQNSDLLLVDPDRVECTTCHRAHFADSGGANDGAGDGYILRAENDDALCRSCHTYGEHNGQSCRTCHKPHDPDRANILLVKPKITTPNSGERSVTFLAETGVNSFADGDQTFDGVCEVCHTATAYHRNDESGGHLHNAAANCTACHRHEDGFSAPSCTQCHNSPQDNGDNVPPGGRRSIMSEFEKQSHHLQGASLDINDCRVCHEMSQHRVGQVRLVDRNNRETVYSLRERPTENPDEARKLNSFCLACHDGDGDKPFSDRQTPPEIDANLWAASSHKLGGASGTSLGCLGDGETFGCHSTGHGSDKRKLLAPADASQPPVPGDSKREEEGMCYSCHDSDGPASTNIQAEFAQQHRHNVSSVDQADGSQVECSNCHNPHLASSSVLLINPDLRGATPWKSTGTTFCLTCHDGKAPGGVSFPSRAGGTGFDKSAFIGSVHETRLGDNSCLRCHRSHGSSYLALLKRKYVVREQTDYRRQNFQACWSCHNENALLDKHTGLGKIHEKHVLKEGFPCIACHDTHGPYDRGEPGLINFKYSVRKGFIQFIDGRNLHTAFWIDKANNEGHCYLKCHRKPHKSKKYRRD